MGNHRFRFSDMMPNAWFYRLKDMGKARSHKSTSTNTQSVKKKQQPSKSASTTGTTQQQAKNHQSQYPRKSYYFTRELTPSDRFYNSPTKTKSTDTHFPDPPRKSSKQKRNRKRTNRPAPKLVSSSISAGCSCRATIWTKTESPPGYSSSSTLDSSPEPERVQENCHRSDHVLVTESFDNMVAWSSSCRCNKISSDNAKDIKVVDVDRIASVDKNLGKLDGFDSLSELELPPIITKPSKLDEDNKDSNEPTKYRRSSVKFEDSHAHGSLSVKVVKEERIFNKEHKVSPLRKYSVNSPGVRLRMKMNSPRIANRKIQAHGRRSTSSSNSSSSSRRSNLSDSFAIVKSSFDPQRDFRESMVEMIVENNIRASKDLEDLLACYLSLNSDEYHELIIKVFKQIWFDLTDVKLKP